jgi:2-C-methyl-D-erythritol 4-phosphate cytidylyltransferase
MNLAIIFAGGQGTRLNGFNTPKQFIEVLGKPLLIHTLNIFQEHAEIDGIYLAISAEHREYTRKLIEDHNISKVKAIVDGGETAQDSIFNALAEAVKENSAESVCLIHDGVRPILGNDVIARNIEMVKKHGNAITCTQCHETILVSEDGLNPKHIPYRKNTYSAQAPQSFRLAEILQAHKDIQNRPERYENMIDACTIYNYLGKETYMIKGNFGNIKATFPHDIAIMEALIPLFRAKQTEAKNV